MLIRAGSSPVARTNTKGRLLPSFCFGLCTWLAEPAQRNALVAGNVYRFAKQMTDFVRQDKLAAERSAACSSVLSPAPNKHGYAFACPCLFRIELYAQNLSDPQGSDCFAPRQIFIYHRTPVQSEVRKSCRP